jgi:hypothetical protein
MKGFMMVFASIALGSLIGVSVWAAQRADLVPAITELLTHVNRGPNPWFIATLFDAYFGFLWFWLWVAYKEPSWIDKLLWLVLILALGNIAMAGYVLLQLTRLPPGADFEDLLLRRWA